MTESISVALPILCLRNGSSTSTEIAMFFFAATLIAFWSWYFFWMFAREPVFKSSLLRIEDDAVKIASRYCQTPMAYDGYRRMVELTMLCVRHSDGLGVDEVLFFGKMKVSPEPDPGGMIGAVVETWTRDFADELYRHVVLRRLDGLIALSFHGHDDLRQRVDCWVRGR